MVHPFDTGLGRTPANYQPLTPLVFLERAASVHPDHVAIIHGSENATERATHDSGVGATFPTKGLTVRCTATL